MSLWRPEFFVLGDVLSQRVYLQEESLPRFSSATELSAWHDLDKFREFLDAFDTANFPLEDKHVVNERT